jgi:hypothetical protein
VILLLIATAISAGLWLYEREAIVLLLLASVCSASRTSRKGFR